MTASGRLFGVGVGPGAPDLMTLRAVRTLRTVPVVAAPVPRPGADSLALRIAAEHLTDRMPHLERLHFPMRRDPERLRQAWAEAATRLLPHLRAGRDVAFLVQGDPGVYATFGYLARVLREWLPELVVERIPAVSSLTAAPAVAGLDLVDGEERLAVVPALYALADLPELLERFDTLVLTKVNRVLDQLVALLAARDLLTAAVYVSRATLPEQRIVRDLRSLLGKGGCDYFSLVVVRVGRRRGALGRTPGEVAP